MSDQDFMNQEVNPTGQGEDPKIKKMIQEGDTMGDAESVLLMRQILMELQGFKEETNQRFNFVEAQLEERKKAEDAWASDRQGFMDKLQDQGNRLLITDPDEKARFQAEVTKKNAHVMAKARMSRAQMEERLNDEPKVSIAWPTDRVIFTNQGGAQVPMVIPAKINIGPIVYEFPAGQVVEVPKSVAERLEQWNADREENEQVKTLLGAEQGGKKVEVINAELAKLPGYDPLPMK